MITKHKGQFFPKNTGKYKGSLPIIYRSLWELKSFRFLDLSPNIVEWGSESVIVPYRNLIDKKIHRYFIDLNFVIRHQNGKLEKHWCEIKPFNFTIAPVQRPGQKERTFLREAQTYLTNKAKWRAAYAAGQSRGIKFTLVTERGLIDGSKVIS